MIKEILYFSRIFEIKLIEFCIYMILADGGYWPVYVVRVSRPASMAGRRAGQEILVQLTSYHQFTAVTRTKHFSVKLE